jgi:hypothetical protein
MRDYVKVWLDVLKVQKVWESAQKVEKVCKLQEVGEKKSILTID